MQSTIFITKPTKDYALLDAGKDMKLERYGDYVLARPDPQALWLPALAKPAWTKADATFVRTGKHTKWEKKKELPDAWTINFANLTFEIRPTSFKHTGLFPEQSVNWLFMESKIEQAKRPVRVLNLFGYTGGATLACARAGAEVCHVDGSKMALSWARKNQELSGLTDKPIRWILDDAVVFLKREVKRGNRYDGIIIDPPAFGHGPNGELWKIEEDFYQLVDLCLSVLSEKPLFFVINGYASGYSPIAYQHHLLPLKEKFGGTIEIGELTIESEADKTLLPCGIVARWSSE